MSKARKDATIKARAEQSEEFGDKVFAWIQEPKTETCVGGFEHARQQLALDGIKTSVSSLWDFYSWWGLRRDFSEAEQQTTDIVELIKQLDPNITAEKIEAAGQLIFTKNAVAKRDAKEFREMEYLKLAKETARTKGHLEGEKLKLAKDKFAVLTCETFLKWFGDEKARAIASAPISNTEKIKQLRENYFADVDALEKSGAVVLPE